MLHTQSKRLDTHCIFLKASNFFFQNNGCFMRLPRSQFKGDLSCLFTVHEDSPIYSRFLSPYIMKYNFRVRQDDKELPYFSILLVLFAGESCFQGSNSKSNTQFYFMCLLLLLSSNKLQNYMGAFFISFCTLTNQLA